MKINDLDLILLILNRKPKKNRRLIKRMLKWRTKLEQKKARKKLKKAMRKDTAVIFNLQHYRETMNP